MKYILVGSLDIAISVLQKTSVKELDLEAAFAEREVIYPHWLLINHALHYLKIMQTLLRFFPIQMVVTLYEDEAVSCFEILQKFK